jgi:hypothetical protein
MPAATARSPVCQARKINTQKTAVRKPAVMATRLFIETGAGVANEMRPSAII